MFMFLPPKRKEAALKSKEEKNHGTKSLYQIHSPATESSHCIDIMNTEKLCQGFGGMPAHRVTCEHGSVCLTGMPLSRETRVVWLKVT
jgi:hypothetical protein